MGDHEGSARLCGNVHGPLHLGVRRRSEHESRPIHILRVERSSEPFDTAVGGRALERLRGLGRYDADVGARVQEGFNLSLGDHARAHDEGPPALELEEKGEEAGLKRGARSPT